MLDAWVAKRAEIARLEAEASDLLAARAALFDADVQQDPAHRDMIRHSMLAEYTAASRVSKTALELGFADAAAMRDLFPGVRGALKAGLITVQHVRVLITAAEPIRQAVRNGLVPADVIALYEQAALVIAEQETPARTRNHAKQIAAVLVDEPIRERHARAAAERGVRIRTLDDGLVELIAIVPELYGVAIMDRLTRLAEGIADAMPGPSAAVVFADAPGVEDELRDPDEWVEEWDLDPTDPRLVALDAAILAGSSTFVVDPAHASGERQPDAGRFARYERSELVARDGRTRRQIEADAFVDLLLASTPSDALGSGLERITATVQVTIGASTLAGEDERLAELDGHGPLHPDLARELARQATGWNRLFLSGSGMVDRVDRYTPSGAMKRFLRARDQRCRFPGCHTPAVRCEIDHNHDHARGGITELTNLSHFCHGHHALKHPDLDDAQRWTAHQRDDGTVRWTSPLGRTYDDAAPRRVMFL